MNSESPTKFIPGNIPITIVMISLNEAHQLEEVVKNVSNWAQEIYLVDSYSKDATIDIALELGIKVVQKKFEGFGEQWNFAIDNLPIDTSWTMKLDPDERLSDELKLSIASNIFKNEDRVDGLIVRRKLWFMGKPIPVTQDLLRVWRTGQGSFTDVKVNEHVVLSGTSKLVSGQLMHLDSPDLEHWFDKQNNYSTSEAEIIFEEKPLADKALIFGTNFQRRMWLKKNFNNIPFRYFFFFLYNFIILQSFRAGRVGFIWAWSRVLVMKLGQYKAYEMKLLNKKYSKFLKGSSKPDPRVQQF
jgi:glycosyltransferase involved in cell wall biosynthesis